MKYIRLGNSELSVSRICMVCMGFGDLQNSTLASERLLRLPSETSKCLERTVMPNLSTMLQKSRMRK